jgi:hypothetical protein
LLHFHDNSWFPLLRYVTCLCEILI